MSSERVRRSRVEAATDTRRRLLDAAWVVFARRGYEGASVQQVAEEAGFTIGAIYSHFRTKQELFLALLEERFATKVGDLSRLVDGTDSLDRQMEALAHRFGRLRETEGDWDLLAAEFALYAARHPEARPPLADRQCQLREGLAQLIAARLRESSIEPATSPSLIAAAVIALGDGLGAMRRLEPDLFPDQLFSTAVHHLVLALAQTSVP